MYPRPNRQSGTPFSDSPSTRWEINLLLSLMGRHPDGRWWLKAWRATGPMLNVAVLIGYVLVPSLHSSGHWQWRILPLEMSALGFAFAGVGEYLWLLGGFLCWASSAYCLHNDKRKDFLTFVAGQGLHVGFVHPKFAEELKRFPGIFTIAEGGKIIHLSRTLSNEKDCTAAVGGVMQILAQEGKIHSWRNEVLGCCIRDFQNRASIRYPVVTSFGSPSMFWLERACVPYLGTKAYHTHMNGFTIVDGEMFLWVSIRDDEKMHQDFPGKFDHLVAGGQPINMTPKENIMRYAYARANMPAEMAEKAVPVRTISYEQIDGMKIKRDVIFCYDIEVPYSWHPKNSDGEVDAFKILRVTEVAKIIRSSTGSYKPNSALVVIDFLFRHGFFNPNEHGYLELQQALQQRRQRVNCQ